MATVTVVTYVCDGCGRESTEEENGIESHKVSLDNQTPIEVDACEECWATATGPMEELLAAGRREGRTRRNRKSAA